MSGLNLRDVAFKLWWTLLPVAVGIVLTAVVEWNPALAGVAAALTQVISSLARQKLEVVAARRAARREPA